MLLRPREWRPSFAAVVDRRFLSPLRAVGDIPSFANAVRVFFNSLNGGFGLRISYDRRLTEKTRMMAGAEMITFGPLKALQELGDRLPAGTDRLPAETTRVSLLTLPMGIQYQFVTENHLVPHVGLAAFPALRFDHHPLGNRYPAYSTNGLQGGVARGGAGLVQIGIPLDEMPTLSVTLGGHVEAGLDIRVGSDRDIAQTLNGR